MMADGNDETEEDDDDAGFTWSDMDSDLDSCEAFLTDAERADRKACEATDGDDSIAGEGQLRATLGDLVVALNAPEATLRAIGGFVARDVRRSVPRGAVEAWLRWCFARGVLATDLDLDAATILGRWPAGGTRPLRSPQPLRAVVRTYWPGMTRLASVGTAVATLGRGRFDRIVDAHTPWYSPRPVWYGGAVPASEGGGAERECWPKELYGLFVALVVGMLEHECRRTGRIRWPLLPCD